MITLEVPRGDRGYRLEFIVQGADGGPMDLAGYTLHLKVWHPGRPGTLLLNRLLTIDNAAAGTCHFVVQTGDFATIGTYRAELELTRTGVVESTRPFALIVRSSG